MRSEVKFGVTFLYPDNTKKLKRVDGDELYSIVVLAKSDTQDNYEEVDELWTPEYVPPEETPTEEEPIVIEPDEEGKISYEDAQKLLSTIDIMKRRIISLQENNDMLTGCILEMSEVVYNA